jgi:hypothetical protein
MASDLSTSVARHIPASARGGRLWLARVAAVVTATGCLALFAFAAQGRTWTDYAQMVAGLFMIAGCAWSVGALFGFLFGIPRTSSSSSAASAGAEAAGDASGAAPGDAPPLVRDTVHYRVNTNLEQISDWLTKMLVGIGLAELHRVPAALGAASVYFASTLGAEAGETLAGFVLAVLVFFSIVGFMTGYLWTRVLLAPLFRIVDTRAVRPLLG